MRIKLNKSKLDIEKDKTVWYANSTGGRPYTYGEKTRRIVLASGVVDFVYMPEPK